MRKLALALCVWLVASSGYALDYLGSFAEDATVNYQFTTNAADGAPIAPNSAFEAADLVIYKDGSATQKTSANGVTMTSPFDSVTGLHQISIDTSDDTGDSGFWQAGHDYTVVLAADETVDGVAVTSVLAQFSIENRDIRADLISVEGTPPDPDGDINVNVDKIGGDAQSLTDLKDFFDAGYDPSTNKVEGVKLADATTVVSAQQTTIYVDDGGNDSNDGLSAATPKLTISAAVTAAGVGGKVIVMPGTYSGAVAISINNVTIEGQNASGCTLTHNSGPTLDIQSRTGITLRNLTITNSAETSSGTGLYAQSSFNTLIEGCYINGKLDAAHFGSATAVKAIRSKFSGAYDGVNLTDCGGVFEQCTFLSDTTHTSTSADKRAAYITATSSQPKLHFADCDFQVLQVVSNNTGKLVGMTSAGSVTLSGANRFILRSLDGDYDGDMVAIVGGDGSADGHVLVEGGVAFYMTTVGAGDIYHAQATIGDSSVRFAGAQYDPTLVTGNVINVSPTAALVNTAVEGGQVGTDTAATQALANGASGFVAIKGVADGIEAVTDALSPRLPGSGTIAIAGDLAGLSTFDASTDDVTLANGTITEDTFDGSTAAPLSPTQAGYIDASIAGISLGSNPNVLLTAEIATVNSQTSFTLASGADFNDAYNGQTIVLYDDSNSDFPSVRVISDYVGSTKTVTIDSAPAFTLGTDDSVAIFATAPGTTAPTAETVATAVRSELTTELGRIDAAVSTRSTLDAAGVRAAIGMASANLDDQIAALPTAAENAATLLATATSDAGAGTIGRLWHYALAGYSASGELAAGMFANQPAAEVELTEQDKTDIATETAELIGASAFSDVDQEPVGDDRTILLTPDDDEGLVGEKAKTLAVGTTPTFAVDFRENMAVNSWITIVDTPTIATGTSGGITFDQLGRDKSLAKFRATGVTAGTYRVRVDVTYYGGATATGFITLKVVE